MCSLDLLVVLYRCVALCDGLVLLCVVCCVCVSSRSCLRCVGLELFVLFVCVCCLCVCVFGMCRLYCCVL